MSINNFEQLLEIENTEDILDFTVPNYNFLLWPYIRYYIFDACAQHYSANFIFDNDVSKSIYLANKYILFIKSITDMIKTRLHNHEIVFLTYRSSLFYKIYKNNLYNQYEEPFACIFPENTLYLDSSPGPELINYAVPYTLCRIQAINLLSGKISKYINSTSYIKNVEPFLHFLDNRIHNILSIQLSKEFFLYLKDKMIWLIHMIIIEHYIYNYLLHNGRCKLFFLDCACYGQQSHIILLAKKLGMRTVEKQHGVVYREHLAYNWAEAIRKDERLIGQMPDFFLTYGTFWNDEVRLPGTRCLEIGNPWFSMQKSTLSQNTLSRCPDGILILLNEDYDSYIPYINAIIDFTHGNMPVILRPHPSLRPSFLKTPLASLPGVTVDMNVDLYDTLRNTSIVVGDFSTSNYEAVALGKRFFLRHSESLQPPEYLTRYFETFSSPDELIEKLQMPNTGFVSQDIQESFFCDDWEVRFRNFVTSILTI
jgi:hypothetical protein